MKIGIITDSSAYLNHEYIDKHKIKLAYLKVIVDGNSYNELLEISNDEVFDYLDKNMKVSSSQPSPEDFVKLYEEFKEEGYTDIIAIHLSSNISGTYQYSKIASELVEGLNVHFFDSQSASIEEEIFIDKAIEMIKTSSKPNQILEKLSNLREKSKIRITIDDLMTLVRGGRLSLTKAKFGNLLKLKPILGLVDGKVEIIDKVRTNKKVIAKIVSEVTEDFEKFGPLIVNITHVNSIDIAKIIKKQI